VRTSAFVDGAFVSAADCEPFEHVSPRNGSVLAAGARCRAYAVGRAVGAARRAFEARAWALACPAERKCVVLALAALIDVHAEELAGLEPAEVGHPISDARGVHRLARRLRAGTVWVNTFDFSSLATPFDGAKASGHGCARSLHAFDAYTHLKTTWVGL
jgi:acyl-CoA reductase-like NAD-dependent aldehyde dehydrogenase